MYFCILTNLVFTYQCKAECLFSRYFSKVLTQALPRCEEEAYSVVAIFIAAANSTS